MSAEDKTRITVDIYGNHYKLLASTGTSTSYMKRVAEYVNDQMFRIAKGYPRLDSQRIAVLAAVNMADECFRLNEAIDELRKAQKDQEESQAGFDKLLQAYNDLKQEELQREELVRQHQEEYQGQLAALLAQHQAEKEELLEQARQEKEELMLKSSQDEDLQSELSRTQKELLELKEEYAKLQTEYNEWIQLAETDSPGR